MWLTMRSIRSAALGGNRLAPLPVTVICASFVAKKSRTRQSAGCTVSSTRSNTAKPTGLVSMAASAWRAVATVPCSSSRNRPLLPGAAARRRNTSRSYHEV